MNNSAAPVDEYMATLSPDQQAELRRIQGIITQTIPEVTQGVSYAMPAYLYRGKALLSCVVNKSFLSIYPFSGKVIDTLRDKLKEYELTTGSVHFTLERILPESLIEDIIHARMQEILGKS